MASRTAASNRDLRVQRTYKLLKEAFIHLLAQKPFEQITVQEICELAMVRRTTFYQHFEDKHDFLSWFIQEKQQEFTEITTAGISPDNLKEYYATAIRNVLKYLSDNEQIVHLLTNAGVQGRLLMEAYSRACVEDVIRRMESMPDIESRLGNVPIPFLAEFYVGGLVAAARWWFGHGKPCTEEQMADHVRWIVGQRTENMPFQK